MVRIVRSLARMSALVLYGDDCSPPVRSVLMLLERLKLQADYESVDLFKGEHLSKAFRALNPAHTVPTLKHGDLVLTDSHAILIHLCEQFETTTEQGLQLWPQSYQQRMEVLNKMFFECSTLFRRDSEFLSAVVKRGYANADVPYHERKINEAYDMMEVFLSQHTHMASNQLSLADFSIMTTLSTVHMLFPVRAKTWPRLREWLDRMQALPEFALNHAGLEKLRSMVETMGKCKFPNAE